MELADIFRAIDQIGAMSFATMDRDDIHIRYAGFFGHDAEGLYFMTMTVKPFYRQLVQSGKLAVCGIFPSGARTDRDAHGMPVMAPGYTLRITGDVREVDNETVKAKADAGHKGFQFAAYDISRYPAMRVFCLYRGKGEIFDFDFEMQNRDHKLVRTRFAFGGAASNPLGCVITDACSGCGECVDACSFSAIEPGRPYHIIGERCDECGSCILVCPADAIRPSVTM